MSGRRDAAPMMFTAFGLALLWGLALTAPSGLVPLAFLLLPLLLRLPVSLSPRRRPWLGAGLLALGGVGALASAGHLRKGSPGGPLLALQRSHQTQGARLEALERASHYDALRARLIAIAYRISRRRWGPGEQCSFTSISMVSRR